MLVNAVSADFLPFDNETSTFTFVNDLQKLIFYPPPDDVDSLGDNDFDIGIRFLTSSDAIEGELLSILSRQRPGI